MSGEAFAFAGTMLTARASGALWWAEARLLCVADLHLGKSERLARRGGTLLPPYETAETLARLAAEIAALSPAAVVCLGDSFDDGAAGRALAPEDAARLAALVAGRDWTWIAGNHDPAPLALASAGRHVAELAPAPSPSATPPCQSQNPAKSPATTTQSCACPFAAAPSRAPASSPTPPASSCPPSASTPAGSSPPTRPSPASSPTMPAPS